MDSLQIHLLKFRVSGRWRGFTDSGNDPTGQFRQTEECYVAAAGAIFSTGLAVIAIATAPVTLGGGFAIAAGFGSVAFSAYGVLSSCQ